MHYNLLFNGCSFTDGAELEGIKRDYAYKRLHRFSHVVSEKTGLTYANIAKSGASNDSILRSTVEWFEEGNTCDHAIIQWSHRLRIELYCDFDIYKRNRDLGPSFFSIYPRTTALYNQRGKELAEKFFDIQSESNDQNNEDRCMYWMERFLRDKCSVDYLKLLKEPKVVDEYYEYGTYHKHRTKVPISYIVGDIISKSRYTDDYCVTYKNCHWLQGSHPSELGHQKIAEHIINNFDYFQ